MTASSTKDIRRRTQVCIIGGGPAGMMLGHMLHRHGIDAVVLERQSEQAVLDRVRAGVLEHDAAQLLRDYGLGERMDTNGKVKDGTGIVWQDRPDLFIDVKRWTDKQMVAWGQTYITEDLYSARKREGGETVCEARDVALHDIESDQPFVTYLKDGVAHRIDASYIAGCDGFHGCARQAIPASLRRETQMDYPFGWLGIMVERPPLEEFTYAYHSEGFALAAQRTPMLSRYYVQAPVKDPIEDWPDERFWETLLRRFPKNLADKIQTGPSIEKSMAPLRSFVCETMRHGRLFLAGDAAHIVPPTGAKGLNLALSDVYYLNRALVEALKHGKTAYLDSYCDTALRRIWAAENLSWRLTKLLHVFPDEHPFEGRLREAEYSMLLNNEAAQHALALEYIGLPYD